MCETENEREQEEEEEGGGGGGQALFYSLSAVERGRCPARRKAEVRRDVPCHRARSFHSSSIVPLSLLFLTPATEAKSIVLYLTHPLLPTRALLAAEAS